MPIQFRCQYCRQLLGISRSRAGSTVDCPACGRTLRVPASEGTATGSELPLKAESNENLRSALEELSSLSLPPSPAHRSPVATAPVPRKNPLQPSSETGLHRDSIRIVPLSPGTPTSEESLRHLAELTPMETTAPLIVPELLDPETSDERVDQNEVRQHSSDAALPIMASNSRPAELAWALQELAEQNPEVALAKAEAIHRPKSTGWLIGSTLAIVAAFVVGIFVGRSFIGRSFGTVPQKKMTSDSIRVGQPDVSEQVSVKKIPERSVTGRVMYADGAGAMKPDSMAFVLLVPAENKSGLKLDARPLRELQATDAKLAVEAAMNVLKGSFTRVAEDGTFALERRHSGPVKLIVISRHASRPDSEAVESPAANTMAAWFESPSQLTGRLQVQEKAFPAAKKDNGAPVEVTFSKQ